MAVVTAPAVAVAQPTTITLCVSGTEPDATPEELAEGIASGAVEIEAVGACPSRPRAPGEILPAPTAPVSDACALVPDIEAIVGRSLMLFGEGLNIPTGSDVMCMWTFNDHPSESVMLTVGRPELWDDHEPTLGILGGRVEDLEQGWLWSPDTGYGATLLARSPAMAAVVSVSLEDDSAEKGVALEVAETALGLR